MNQKALLAEVVGLNPNIFIDDEPTKGLDRDRISDFSVLLNKMSSNERGMLVITHDILLARNISDIVMVVYAGEVVERGKSENVLAQPYHPYTRSLLMSLPENWFVPIPGISPALSDLPTGCRFSPRCQHAKRQCHEKHPELITRDGRGGQMPQVLMEFKDVSRSFRIGFRYRKFCGRGIYSGNNES